ncbi:MAG: DUF58 domain-containing protein [Pirellulaceae bacterium]|nr:DUF58 domain-containing protein [Pirellulaceae bacterium]
MKPIGRGDGVGIEHPTESATAGQTQTYSQTLWRRWLDRYRRRSDRLNQQVRFRLSREGFHFLMILLFILVGAVLRDISLLVVLAGVMFALLLIQWRIGTRSVSHLELKREVPSTTVCGLLVDVRITVANRRRWLGSWLLTVEDHIEQTAPSKRVENQRALTVIDDVAPGRQRQGVYQLQFHQRGHYRIGPTTLSTRYPLNLGRSMRQFLNRNYIIVHPKLGTLTNRCHELFRIERQGLSRAIARAGVNEGEFFGLRQWHNGDSQRWIHWRTTARLGELSVRQFEQQQRMQAVVVLDLHARPDDLWSLNEPAAVEKAISFMATLAVELVGRGRHKLSVAIAGREIVELPNVQSRILVNDLLDHLASAASTAQKDALPIALERLQASLVRNPLLIVVSTRSNALPQTIKVMPDTLGRRVLERVSLRWLNVAADDLEPYFQWSETKSSASVDS